MSVIHFEILTICRDYFLFDEFGNRNRELPDDVEIVRDGDPYDDEEYIIQYGTHVARVEVSENFPRKYDEISATIEINTGTFNDLNYLYYVLTSNQ